MTQTWIILGATSTIGRAFQRRLAQPGVHLVLAGRNMAEMEASAADAEARGATSEIISFDARKPETFAAIVDTASARKGVLNAAVFVGSMPPQDEIDADPSMIAGVVADSFTGPAQILTALAPVMEARGDGLVIGVGSVAGDRGRLGNYVYGAAKAGFATYLSGLRNRLGRKGVHVMTVKPGPVDTAMTWGLGKQPLMTSPEAAVEDIVRAMEKRRNVIYTRGIWRVVMAVIRAVPEPIFKKLSI